MAIFTKDGLTLIPELMDGATLRTNILTLPVKGRDRIATILEALESLYVSIVDLDRVTTSGREYILSQALLYTGERATIKIVGLRDDNGWIATVRMTHEPRSVRTIVAGQLSICLRHGDQAA